MKPPQLRDTTLAAIEDAIIEATGNGDAAAYTVKYLEHVAAAPEITDAMVERVAKAIRRTTASRAMTFLDGHVEQARYFQNKETLTVARAALRAAQGGEK